MTEIEYSTCNVEKKSMLKYRDTSAVNNSCDVGVGPGIDINAAIASMLGVEDVGILKTEYRDKTDKIASV